MFKSLANPIRKIHLNLTSFTYALKSKELDPNDDPEGTNPHSRRYSLNALSLYLNVTQKRYRALDSVHNEIIEVDKTIADLMKHKSQLSSEVTNLIKDMYDPLKESHCFIGVKPNLANIEDFMKMQDRFRGRC